jgi:ATP-dependent helicase/DNAse subunit B
MSASQVNTIAHCLYSHFGTKRLQLQPLAAPEVDALSLGSVAHRILAELGRADFAPEALDEIFAAAWNDTVQPEMRDDPEVQFDRGILLDQLRAFVEAERVWLDGTSARPTHFELAFGLPDDGRSSRDQASLPDGLSVTLPPGTPLDASTLRGSIDRVDVLERDGKRYGIAIDYKLGKTERYRKEMYEQADFQLPIYCELLPHFGIEPVGAIYLGLADGERHGVIREDFADAFLLEPKSCKGVRQLPPEAFAAFMRERQDALRAEIARVARGELEVAPRDGDCKYCDLRPVCRIGTFGVGGANGDE